MWNTPNAASDLRPAVTELQGLGVALLPGAASGNKIDLAAIRSNDTVLSAFNNNAGTLTDITANVTISDLRATGTLTCSTAVAGNTAIVNGVTYTLSDAPTAAHTSVLVGADDTETAANLAAAINAVETGPGSANAFFATSALGVVTITATAEGVDGNAITLVGSVNIVASAATLEGGTATGGIEVSSTTQQVLLFWFNKG